MLHKLQVIIMHRRQRKESSQSTVAQQ